MNHEAVFSGCVGKLPYSSKIEALAVIARRKKKHAIKPKGRGQMHPYKCRHCDRWHIGSVAL